MICGEAVKNAVEQQRIVTMTNPTPREVLKEAVCKKEGGGCGFAFFCEPCAKVVDAQLAALTAAGYEIVTKGAVEAKRQVLVGQWVVACWGEQVMNPHERALRVLEEAAELAQAEGVLFALAVRVLDVVFSRPPGQPEQEAGGIGVTLLAWAYCRSLSLDALIAAEIARVLAKPIAHFQTRQAEKASLGISEPPPRLGREGRSN